MKQWTIALLFIFPFLASAQNFEDRWTGHFSYVSIKDISQGNNKIYVGAENAVFYYDISTQKIKTLSTVNGLSGNAITTIYYSEDYNLLIIGYEDGLMEIVKDGEERVLKVVDILEKQTIPPDRKRINNFTEFNGKLYIATQYGISVYDLARLEFGDTYFIGDGGGQIDIVQTIIKEPYIFAASATDGMRRALVADDNLIDFENWTTIMGGGYRAAEKLGNDLYAANRANTILRFTSNGATTEVKNFSAQVLKFRLADNLLTITTNNSVQAYSEGFVEAAAVNNVLNYDLDLLSGYGFDDNFYIGTNEDGLLIVPFGSMQADQILPNGPERNSPYAIDASPGQLWVNFGEIDKDYNPYPLSRYGISVLKDTLWNNISYEDLSAAVGAEPTDLVNVTINPKLPNEVYMSSFQKGLLKIVDDTPTILYDETNSPLDRIMIGNDDAGIRIYGSDFDPQGNLWFAQTKTDEGLIKLTPGGQFQKVDLSSVITNALNELAITQLDISRENYVFMGSYSNGLIGYNPTTNRLNKIGQGPGNGNLPSAAVRTIAFDAQNRLWIGTLKGLRVLYSPGSFFEEGTTPESQAIIILEDGVAQELLYEQTITDIEVDGSNNKWIATTSSGVFYLSANGQETLLRFTKDNSPLPSNTVQDIAIDPFTGVVYFATLKGLVAYKGTATAPGDNLENLHAFPNPVRPGFSGNVTIDGLTAQANVKITDITGNLVFEETSEGGSVLWDTTAFGKYKVRSGVYLVLVTTDDNTETKVSKIMIIR
ncbi:MULTISPECIES: type IX secretion system anionic LPS delivery protein PorZ [Aequorivita]|uniref:Two-component regulator propeller domain-containing protein n=2 Tax=Aequorivita TaxID=153265 RepID=A0AB35YU95_9FLAO|nr:two-component regulator propeller domain-containing protein [Aequorivita sp. Ant34-E75]WGF93400.1 two-component regulator propeller domain-containing protein [Aequorivita sp. Ant34-E75]